MNKIVQRIVQGTGTLCLVAGVAEGFSPKAVVPAEALRIQNSLLAPFSQNKEIPTGLENKVAQRGPQCQVNVNQGFVPATQFELPVADPAECQRLIDSASQNGREGMKQAPLDTRLWNKVLPQNIEGTYRNNDGRYPQYDGRTYQEQQQYPQAVPYYRGD